MSRVRRLMRCAPLVKAAAVLGAAVLLAAGGGPGAPLASAAGDPIVGAGSTWSYNAVNQWIADVRVQGTTVDFSPNGSGQGRSGFANGGAGGYDFANSDIPYQGTDPLTGQPDSSPNRPYAYIPIIAGGTALMYQLKAGNNLIRNVRLSGDTIAKIFTGKITMWNDQQITADMNGHALPAKSIKVIVDSAGGGTTAQFTDWLVHEHGDIWGPFAGQNKSTSYYPHPPGFTNLVTAVGDANIAATITAPQYDGAIGYAQYSYAINSLAGDGKPYPVAKVLNAGSYYTAPTPYRVSRALTQAYIEENNHDPAVYLTQKLEKVYPFTDPASYRLSSYSYMIIPTSPNDHTVTTEGKAQTFANFSYYGLCDGQAKAFKAGYAPLPYNLVVKAFEQVTHFSHMRPEFQTNRNPSSCDNPTFDKSDFSRNKLSDLATVPPDCDKQGQGPCNDDGSNPLGNPGQTPNGADPNAPNGNRGAKPPGTGNAPSSDQNLAANTDSSAPTSSTDPAADPANGGGSNSNSGNGSAVAGSSTEVAAFRTRSVSAVMGVLAAAELVLCLLAPAFVMRAMERRRAAQQKGSS